MNFQIHGLGLKFGMYQDYGTSTCAGYPGVLGHEKIDVETFLEWEIDYLKLDGCYVNTNQMDTGWYHCFIVKDIFFILDTGFFSL